MTTNQAPAPLNPWFSEAFLEVDNTSGSQGRLCVLSCVQLFVTSWTIAHQAPLSMAFFRQEYWSGLPYPPPVDLPNPGMEPASPELTEGFFATRTTWKALHEYTGR